MSPRLVSELLGGILGICGEEVASDWLLGRISCREHLQSRAKCHMYLKQLSIQNLFHQCLTVNQTCNFARVQGAFLKMKPGYSQLIEPLQKITTS